MATPPSKDDVLSFGILVDIRASLQAMEKFSRSMKKSMKQIAESGERMGKQSQKTSKQGKKDTDRWANSLENLNEKYEYHNELLKKRGDVLRALREQAGNNDDQIAVLEKEYKQIVGVMKAARTLKEKGGLFSRSLAPKGLKKALVAAGEGLKQPLQNFLKRDAQGLVEEAANGFTATMKRSYHGMRLFTRVGGASLKRRGEAASISGKAAGGLGGGLTRAGGFGMKALGGMMGKISSLMRPLAALGPFLQTAMGGITGLIKLFIDCDALVKDFNRGIMDSASNLEFLGRAGGNARVAIADMADALEGTRAAAMDYAFNNALGITKDTHVAILNTLTQEGVAFGALAGEAGNSAAGMKDLMQSIVKTGVAYSRGLGVPLNEIATLQAEMVVEMGNGAQQTEGAFAKISRAAVDSGLAGNKFFGIIRAASADLSLWNLRLDGAVDLLSKLNRVMSPRAAQSFFQSIASGFKSMGRQDLLKQTLLAGVEKVRTALKEDVGEGQKELAEQIVNAGGGGDLGTTPAERQAKVLKAIQTEGYRGADRMIRQVKDISKLGVLRDKAAELQRKSQGTKGGTYEVSQASGEIESMGSQINILVSALESQGGSLLEPNKMALSAVAENMGISQQQVRQLHSMALAVDTQKKILMDQAKDDPKRQAEIAKMSWQQIINSDETLKSQSDKLLKDQVAAQETVQSAIQKMSEYQGEKTQKLTDKLENLVDWFMNQFYGVVMGIWETLVGSAIFGNDESRAKLAAARGARGSGELSSIAARGGDLNAGLAGSQVMHTFMQYVGQRGALSEKSNSLNSQIGGLEEKLSNTNREDPQYKLLEQQLAEAKAQKAKTDELLAGINEMVKMAAFVKPDTLADSLEMAGFKGFGPTIGGHKARTEFKENVEKYGYEEAAHRAGATQEQTTNALGKTAWSKERMGQKFYNFRRIDEIQRGLGLGAKGSGAAPTPSVNASTPVASPASPAQVTADATQTTSEGVTAVVSETQRTQAILEQRGVSIAPATLKEEEKGMEAAMLSALRTALFEYYMYSGTDRGSMITAMRAGGVGPQDAGRIFTGASLEGGGTQAGLNALGTKPTVLPAHALGGYVTGIANGLAVVAAQGEGLASVGRGERIAPAAGGGSGGNVNVTVNGVGGSDLARLIEGKVVDGIREYKRREKFN